MMTTHQDAPVESLPRILLPHWRGIILAAFAAGVLGAAGSFLIPPWYTARTAFITPQSQQGLAGAALASLGALSGLAGAVAGVKSPGDQYVGLLQSATISNRIIEKFKLVDIYDVQFKMDARKELAANARFGLGKKDNIISIEVDDRDPQRAADMANAYLQELRDLSEQLNLTDAQQRRAFFEKYLKQTQVQLQSAQQALQRSGFNPGALKAEPKAAAEAYSTLQARTVAAEVKLQGLRQGLSDSTAEVQQQLGVVTALRAQLAKLERPEAGPSDQDYLTAYREFKYQETLFEIFARQFEIAKVDESRESSVFQIVDVAMPPERKSRPKRSVVALGAMVAGFLAACFWYRRRHLQTHAANAA
ncbi:MAG: lipopolysaccharide biosynthesis protein [Burkholderiales bacterium]|nr:MAG: lipopolysaccharide biosynthesis protein [Burkholderiales bacterium]